MLRSLFSAISGLQAHQTKMDVVGNNIANVNTVGYKSSTTVFEDTLSQLLRNGSAPTATTAGTNPAQVGLGVKVGEITTNFSQGSTQSTGRATDFMISGDGFFVTKQGSENFYTRAGSFDLDATGRLITPDGAILQGWTANANGVVNTNGPVGNLTIPFGQTIAPSASTDGTVAGNLDSRAATGTAVQTSITMYDSQGNPHALNYTFTKTGANAWSMSVLNGTTPMVFTDSTGAALAGSPTTQTLTFDAAGNMTSPSSPSDLYLGTGMGASWPGPIDVDLSGVTQFGGSSTALAKTPVSGGGSAMGTLQSFSLGDDGSITGVYTNGKRQLIGQLALATFANPAGLTKAGNSSYRVGDNSGDPQVGTAGSGGRGSLSAGALEMSNVDLSQEFTGLIIAQRGFQANSKVITTSDQILQDLVQMKQ
jgi:flagellar hook protein FlgE